MGKSTISMAIFNSYVSLPEGRFFLEQEVHGSQSLGPLDLQFLNPCSMRIPWHPNSHSPGKRHPRQVTMVVSIIDEVMVIHDDWMA